MNHDLLISFLEQFGFENSDVQDGVCRGVTAMWAQAVCCSKLIGDLRCIKK
jgi:hypothetical protein